MHSTSARRARSAPHTAALALRAGECAPSLSATHVARPKLCALLDDCTRYRLTVLTAPPGAGKTLLLREWARQTSRPATWWRAQHVDDATLDCLHDLPPRSCVIVDDIHLLGEARVQKLRELLPATDRVNWIVSGRGIPDLGLAEFALADQLRRIDAAELDVDSRFIFELARAGGRREFTLDDADRFFALTEGWIGGVKLALLPREAKPDATAHGFADAYFASVLQTLPAPQRAALLVYSLVAHIDADLARALADSYGGAIAPLETILEAQLFLREQRNAFRFNDLFRDYLSRRALHSLAERLPTLQRCAAQWYAAHKQHDLALRHAVNLGSNIYLDLLAQSLRAFLKQGAIDRLLHWSQSLDDETLYAREAIWTSHVTALILSRRFAAAAPMRRDASTPCARCWSWPRAARRCANCRLQRTIVTSRRRS